jgi:hypothetical protein
VKLLLSLDLFLTERILMKKYWRAMLLFSTLLIAVLASSVVFTNKAHAADPTCGSLSTTFDMSGA